MEKIVGTVSSLPKSKVKSDDDFIDRLSSRYTVVIMVVFALVVTLQTYVGSAITCWAPKHFTGSHEKYTNSYCWVRNTYYVPFDENIPKPGEKRDHIPYYQWVPFILLIQAIFFYLPSVFWHGFNQKGGVDCDNILESSHSLTMASKVENRGKILGLITNQMHRFLISRHKKQTPFHCNIQSIMKKILSPFGTKLGNYLVLLFLFSKILYMANVVAQLFILNGVLATEYNIYGFQVLEYMTSSRDWEGSPGVTFPRVTFCDFDIRRLGNLHRYTVQCTLPINMYTEKIYMFLWFWMVFIAIVTALGFVVWLFRAIFGSDRKKFILNHLRMGGKEVESGREQDLTPFVNNYLAQDGVFVLRLIAHNTNTINVTELTCSLWDKFMMVKSKVPGTTPDPPQTEYYPSTTEEKMPLTSMEKGARN